MTQRDRAWRRRKTRLILTKLEATKNWLVRQLQRGANEERPKTKTTRKGSPAPALRQAWALHQEMREAF